MTKKVLVIDDEVDICRLLSGYLRLKGYEVKFANTLADGVETLKEFNPNAVILDLNLPDGSGFSIVPTIRAHNPNLGIIIISAYDNFNEKNRARKEEVNYFLPKPFNLATVGETLKAMIGEGGNNGASAHTANSSGTVTHSSSAL